MSSHFEANEIEFARPSVSSKNQRSSAGRGAKGRLAPVFNLTVEGAHCYYANGVLVHNCDTVSQALRFLREAGMLTRAIERAAERDEAMRLKNTKKQVALYPS